MDAFCALDTWHRWQELVDLTHLGIARRPGAPRPGGPPGGLLRQRQVDNPAALGDKLAGSIAVVDIPMLDISASRVRRLLATGEGARFLVPDPVLALIHERGLYGSGA
jgi:nicotinate-nucleotide adenylyltransferase